MAIIFWICDLNLSRYFTVKKRKALAFKCRLTQLVMKEKISVHEITFKLYVVTSIKNEFEFLECIIRAYEYIRLTIWNDFKIHSETLIKDTKWGLI